MQYIKIDDTGNKFYYKDKEMTIYHRKDGPAVELNDGTKEWYRNDKRHRKDGPAVWSNGTKEWWMNGKLHRKDGPAVEWYDGGSWWYLNGERMTKEEHSLRTQKVVELTLSEIAKRFDVPVEKVRIKD